MSQNINTKQTHISTIRALKLHLQNHHYQENQPIQNQNLKKDS